ncbi:MAG: hypothetical protein N4A49_09145 [Marinifilaceae bacterium]|jgi:hypothetical protein|nr:hypothetical protein [Marinifilaceae bacterium]
MEISELLLEQITIPQSVRLIGLSVSASIKENEAHQLSLDF